MTASELAKITAKYLRVGLGVEVNECLSKSNEEYLEVVIDGRELIVLAQDKRP